MAWFKVNSIRSKLIYLSTAISMTAVLVVTAVTAWHAYESRKTALHDEIQAIGEVLSANLQASLAFGDSLAAQETLSALSALKIETRATVVSRTGEVLASYGLASTETLDAPSAADPGQQELRLSIPIQQGGKTFGDLRIAASLSALDAAIREIVLLSAGVMVAATLIAWVLATALGKRISQPIEHLVETMSKVTDDRDFARRAVRTTEDETGQLIDGFNTMIDTIEGYSDELAEALDRAEHASSSKTRFLATMSHELRTPLNAVIGFSEVIRDELLGDRPEVYRAYAKDINNSARYLLDLINDLLDMSRLDAKSYVMEEKVVEIHTLVDTCVRMLSNQSEEKGINIVVDLDSELKSILADDRAMHQVLLNLLGNAVKFTPENGRIEVRSFMSDGRCEITVADNGPGIPPEDLERVMEPFEQARSHLSREHGGSGLGLAISRSLIELHGGALQLQSALGDGTVARIRIPAERVVNVSDS